ncbi:MAG: endonuclease/exonuclease/phosphatase family protein [Flavobacteriaceae bacterium]
MNRLQANFVNLHSVAITMGSDYKKTLEENVHTIVFYNLENLFDTVDDPDTLDDDFTPEGQYKWNKKKYGKKLYMLAKAIFTVGYRTTKKPPVLVGLAEVENRKVIKDLLSTGNLKKCPYGIVHYDSPDERGIDTGLIYDERYFEVLDSAPIPVFLYEEDGKRDTTRDILYVHGKLNGEEVYIYVNHWPSRREGEDESDHKRMVAAETLLDHVVQVRERDPDPNFLILGDFNDNPDENSVRRLTETGFFYNPMEKLLNPHEMGTTNRNKRWSLFDQILISHNFLNYEEGTHSFMHADIFNEDLLSEWDGKYKGNPFRTFAGGKYLGGYSDHFPVYVKLRFNERQEGS